MGETLYRKYRPQQFSEVVGQRAVLTVLQNALKLGRVGHAYLLTGPRGTGKTTLARLFAKAVNCSDRSGFEPCGKCVHCRMFDEGRTLDVIEIDAASHTSVDNIRELLETVKLPPAVGSHKIYIIDEVHMLSQAAFNALLKTLEEPPAHVVFFLATTELHKVPETILSRCQRFDLGRISVRDIIGKLETIVKREKLKAEPEALAVIAESAEGGLRDAESLLTQVTSLTDGKITEELVLDILGATRREHLYRFLEAIGSRDLPGTLALIRTLADDGVDFAVFSGMLLRTARDLLYLAVSPSAKDALDIPDEAKERLATLAARFAPRELATLLELLDIAAREAKKAIVPELPLEIAVAKFITPETTPPPITKPPAATPITPQPEPAPTAKPSAPVTTSTSAFVRKTSAPVKTEEVPENVKPNEAKGAALAHTAISFDRLREIWPNVLAAVRAKNPSFGLALSQCHPTAMDGPLVVLSTRYPIHGERLKTDAGRLTVEEAFATMLGSPLRYRVDIDTSREKSAEPTADPGNPLVSQALTMLGGEIVG